MPLDIRKNFFETKDEVLEDIRKTGFWPTTFVSNESPELPVHWHEEEVHGYVLEGETYLVDGETGEHLPFGVGDKLVHVSAVIGEGTDASLAEHHIGIATLEHVLGGEQQVLELRGHASFE